MLRSVLLHTLLGLLMSLSGCDEESSSPTAEPPAPAPPDAGPARDADASVGADAAPPLRSCIDSPLGYSTLQRLNRTEYANTIQELLAVDYDPTGSFPMDERGYGFDNIAAVLSMSPLLVEKHFFSARDLCDLAIDPQGHEPLTARWEAEDIGRSGGAVYADFAWDVWDFDELRHIFELPLEGLYRISVRAFGQQAGDETVRMRVSLDRSPLATLNVEAVEAEPAVFVIETDIGAGQHELSIAFLNEYRDPTNPDPARRDRNLLVDWLQVDGPLDLPPPTNPGSRQRLIPCDPSTEGELACGSEALHLFAERAWRRPLQDDEAQRLAALLESALGAGDSFVTAFKLGLRAVLLSPNFLFRVEGLDAPEDDSAHPISAHELATRLAYFLWSQGPDDSLRAAAQNGELETDEGIKAQVRRMLADPKAAALTSNFAGQWLAIRAIDDIDPDPNTFPSFDEPLREAMRQEAQHYFSAFLDGGHSMMELLDAEFTFVNDRLAHHYGLPESGGADVRPVDVSGVPARGGLLTQAGLLAATSYRHRTSPVRRGYWVLEQLLCSPVAAPPPDIPLIPDEPQEGQSLRERMEQHRADPNCAGCHEVMDPIGFGLEGYDAIGAWRGDTMPAEESAGTLPDGRSFNTPEELAALISDDPAFGYCVVSKLLTYALGRGVETEQACVIPMLYDAFVADDHALPALIEHIAVSAAFRSRRSPPGGEP